jgi:hypothetical protein
MKILPVGMELFHEDKLTGRKAIYRFAIVPNEQTTVTYGVFQ